MELNKQERQALHNLIVQGMAHAGYVATMTGQFSRVAESANTALFFLQKNSSSDATTTGSDPAPGNGRGDLEVMPEVMPAELHTRE